MKTEKQCFEESVCLTHFISLLFDGKPIYRIVSVIGHGAIQPFVRLYNRFKSGEI